MRARDTQARTPNDRLARGPAERSGHCNQFASRRILQPLGSGVSPNGCPKGRRPFGIPARAQDEPTRATSGFAARGRGGRANARPFCWRRRAGACPAALSARSRAATRGPGCHMGHERLAERRLAASYSLRLIKFGRKESIGVEQIDRLLGGELACSGPLRPAPWPPGPRAIVRRSGRAARGAPPGVHSAALPRQEQRCTIRGSAQMRPIGFVFVPQINSADCNRIG